MSIPDLPYLKLKTTKPVEVRGMNTWLGEVLIELSKHISDDKIDFRSLIQDERPVNSDLDSLASRITRLEEQAGLEQIEEEEEDDEEEITLSEIDLGAQTLAELRVLGAAHGLTVKSKQSLLEHLRRLQAEDSTQAAMLCRRCGGKDHPDARSRKCPKNKRRKSRS